MVSGQDMALALSSYLNMPPLELGNFTPNPELSEVVPKETMRRHLVIPIARVGKMLTVALGDPFDVVAVEEVQARTGLDVFPVVAPETQVLEIAQRIAGESAHGLEDVLKDVHDGEIELSLD